MITFPKVNPWLTPHCTVAFAAVANGERSECEISTEALQDHFGARTLHENDLVRAFISGKDRIHEVARRKYPHAAGRWLLVTADF